MNASDGLSIRLLGQISIERQGRPLSIPPTKSLELLCYVLLSDRKVHTREALSNVLWPDATPVSSKRYLRQALWRLNTTLRRPDAKDRPALLDLDAGLVRLKTGAPIWLDVSAFERAHVSLRDVPGDRLNDQQAEFVRTAVELYRGELMPTWYQDWCIYERERLQSIRIMMLETLMAYCASRQRFARAIAYGQAILRHDRARERTHRELMRLYYLTGDRTAAMRQYERCTRALADEFDLRPDGRTMILHQQIRADRLDETGSASAPDLSPGGPRDVDLLVDVRRQLESIQDCLRTIQDLVRAEPPASNGHRRPLSARPHDRDHAR